MDMNENKLPAPLFFDTMTQNNVFKIMSPHTHSQHFHTNLHNALTFNQTSVTITIF